MIVGDTYDALTDLGGAQGQASDIEITAREIMKTKRELYEILAAHSGTRPKPTRRAN